MPECGRASEPGWVRIGTPVDEPGRALTEGKLTRRSLWFRINLKPDAKPCSLSSNVFYKLVGDQEHPYAIADIESVELCAGREGDDAYVKIDSGIAELVDVLLTAEFAVEVEEEPP
jgi:hypothetical protein